MKSQHTEFDLDECIETVVDGFAVQAYAKGLELACQLSANLPHRVIGDSDRIGRILGCLLDNALTFTPTGEVIVNARMQTHADDQACVHIEVMDTGIGLSAEDCQKVLSPLAPSHGSITRTAGSPGPGLVIARELVESLNGEIGVTSELGAGACFWFWVPLRVIERSVSAGTPVEHPSVVRKVLLVARHRATREIVVAYARELGVEVLHCARTDETRALLRNLDAAGGCIDALMLDADLPDLEILATEGAIGRAACPDGLGRILLIPVGQDQRTDRCAQLGLDACLTKPVRRSRLLDCLAGLESAAEKRLDTAIRRDPPAEPGDSPVPAVRETRDQAATPVSVPQRPTILMVDDDRTMHLLARSNLEPLGFTYTEAMSGEEALAKVGALLPHLVILDVMMPGIDGFETCRRLRATAGCELIPILIVTGLDDLESIEHAYACGATDFLAKPINWSFVTYRLRYLLRSHATLVALHASEAHNSALIAVIPDTVLRLDRTGRILQLEPGNMAQDLVSPAVTRAAHLADLFPETLCAVIMHEIAAALAERLVREIQIELPSRAHASGIFNARFSAVDSEQVIVLLRDLSISHRQTETSP